jgi:hypothetical protein
VTLWLSGLSRLGSGEVSESIFIEARKYSQVPVAIQSSTLLPVIMIPIQAEKYGPSSQFHLKTPFYLV